MPQRMRLPARPPLEGARRLQVPALVLAVAATACTTAKQPPTGDAAQAELPADPAHLQDTGVQARVRTALQLADQHRFSEARQLLSRLRTAQPAGSAGWRALTTSMAVLALRAGDRARFRALMQAAAADTADDYRVAPGRATAVTVHRAWTGAPPPGNTPPRLREVLERLAANTGGADAE